MIFKRFQKKPNQSDQAKDDLEQGARDEGATGEAEQESALLSREEEASREIEAADAEQMAEQHARQEEAAEQEKAEKRGFFGFMKKTAASPKSEAAQDEDKAEAPTAEVSVKAESENSPEAAEASAEAENKNFFARIKRGLARTSTQFSEELGNILFGKKEIDEELIDDIESQLLLADVGVEATDKIMADLAERVARKQLDDGRALFLALRANLAAMLKKVEAPLLIKSEHKPFVILVVGVNGVGKTTTIGKLAKRLQKQGKKVMLAAGDTFRAAAVEQLQIWGDRNNVPVVAQASGADSASVIFDAVQSAKARQMDVVIADTAGRLHNKAHLMDELAKVKRVMAKLDPSAPHEVLLVLDAGTGQNALVQAQHFIDAVGVSGIALTKLDGTAKGGVIFALSDKFGIPIRYIGVGETIDDLQPFAAETFAEALLPMDRSW